MKMSSMVGVCTAMAMCLVVGTAQAGPNPGSVKHVAKKVSKKAAPKNAHLRGHLYINLATGERTVTPIGNGSDYGDPVWTCNDTAGNGNYFWGIDNKAQGRIGMEGLDWGDTANDVTVDGFEFAYAGDKGMGLDPNGEGVPGLNMEIYFYNNENGFGDSDGAAVAGFSIIDLPGVSGNYTYEGWIVTIDLAGTGYEFLLSGNDEDGDGLQDFGYSYSCDQQQKGGPGIMGPLLAAPNAGEGQEDAFDLYTEPSKSGYINSYYFGGFPFAGFDMVLYGSIGGGNECYADCDGDKALTLFDFLCFVNDFNVSGAYADCDNDKSWTLFDFLCFVNAFNAGCP